MAGQDGGTGRIFNNLRLKKLNAESYLRGILFFSSNKQVATDDAEGSVMLHPSYLVRLESL